MASIALVAAFGTSGAAVGSAAFFGNAALAVAGSIIDNALLFPALFPKPDREGPRVDDWPIGQSFEGAPLGWVDGQARIEGIPIYLGEPIEEQVTIGGGKAGPDSTQYRYKRDVVILFTGEVPAIGAYATDFWINGDRVFRLNPNVSIVSPLISAENVTQTVGGAGLFNQTYYRLTLVSPANGPDLRQLQKGYYVTVSGFAFAGNNITPGGSNLQDDAILEDTYQDVGGSTRAVFRLGPFQTSGAPGSPFGTVAAGPTITVTQTLPQLIPGVADSIEFYTGASGQLPDSFLEAVLGPGQVPSYEGLFCIRLGGFNMTRYGNGLASYQATLVTISPTNLGEHIARVMKRAGVPSERFDTFNMAGPFIGAVARGPQPAADLLSTALMATGNVVAEQDGELRFQRRPVLVDWVLTEGEMGAVEYGDDLPASAYPVTDQAEQSLPRAITVQHMDPDLDFGTGAPRQFAPPPAVGDEERISLRTWAMSREAALKVAWSAIWSSRSNRQRVRFTLPPSRLDVLPGHLVQIPSQSANPLKVLLTSRTIGANAVLEYEGLVETPEVHLFQPSA